MAVVTVNSGESIESALRRFKRKVMTEEIIKDAKKHAFFMPPGQKAKLNQLWLESGIRRKAARGPPRQRQTLVVLSSLNLSRLFKSTVKVGSARLS
jgi:small subunit ribosomal protein S21